MSRAPARRGISVRAMRGLVRHHLLDQVGVVHRHVGQVLKADPVAHPADERAKVGDHRVGRVRASCAPASSSSARRVARAQGGRVEELVAERLPGGAVADGELEKVRDGVACRMALSWRSTPRPSR